MRRFDLVQTMRLFRSAQFRPLVLHAFSHRCAVCDYDLKMVDAAHIVPVVDHRSTDEVTNGLALCRLHYAAFDNALLGVQSNYRIIVNPNAADRLRELNLATAFDDFKERLPEKIRTPASIEARPQPEYLRLGLRIRGWPSGLIA